MTFRGLVRAGAFIAVLAAAPLAGRAGEPVVTTRLLLITDAPGLAPADAEALARSLRAALGSRKAVKAFALPEVTAELAKHPSVLARHVGVNGARDLVEEALRRYRSFDYEGALAMFEKARGACLVAAPVTACRQVLMTSYLHEAAALLARDGALGAAGVTAVGAAAALAPDAELRAEDVRPEVIAAFGAAKDGKLVAVSLVAPAEGFVLIDGRTRVDLPAREVWVSEGIHYFELFRIGSGRAYVRATVPRSTPVRLDPAPVDPDSGVADLVEALVSGAAPRSAEEGRTVAVAAFLDEVVLVRAESAPGGGGVHLMTSILHGAGEVSAPAPLVIARATAAPGEDWVRPLVGPPDPPSRFGPDGRRRGAPAWVWGVAGAVSVIATIVVFIVALPPANATLYWVRPE